MLDQPLDLGALAEGASPAKTTLDPSAELKAWLRQRGILEERLQAYCFVAIHLEGMARGPRVTRQHFDALVDKHRKSGASELSLQTLRTIGESLLDYYGVRAADQGMCHRHPAVPAVLRCKKCLVFACAKCKQSVKAGTGSLDACVRCGGSLQRVGVPVSALAGPRVAPAARPSSAPAPVSLPCARHPELEGPWECARCQKRHCDACVRKIKAGDAELEGCAHCDGTLQRTVRTVARPADDLADLLARPFSMDGLLAAAVLATLGWLGFVPAFGRIFRIFYAAAVPAFFVAIIDHVGEGKRGLPSTTEGLDDLGSVRTHSLRGVLFMLLFLAPALVWSALSQDSLEDVLSSPKRLLVLVLVPMVYLPAAILAVVLSNSTVAAVWPIAWVQIIARVPASYLRVTLLFAVAAFGGWLVHVLGDALFGWIPFVGSFVSLLSENVLLMVPAVLLGGFLRRNATELGYDAGAAPAEEGPPPARGGLKVFAILAVLAIVGVVGVLFAPSGDRRADAAGSPARCQAALAANREAAAWLEEPGKRRGLFRWPRERAIALVREIEARNAAAVLVDEPAMHGDLELADTLVIVLAEDAEARSSVLAWYATRDEAPPVEDRGQRCLFLSID